MSAINEILASCQYTDKRGREWNYDSEFGVWIGYESERDDYGILNIGWIVDEKDVRLLIERDQHRDVCPGLRWCLTHPVVSVDRNRLSKSWQVWGPGDWYRTSLVAFPEAMDAARALAVEP